MKISLPTKRILSLILVFAMSLCLLPAGRAYDAQIDTEVTEVVSLREENVKHFHLGNGVYQAVAYSYPVHRADENGNWQDIDNTLTLSNTRSSQRYITSDARVSFAPSFSLNEQLLVLQDDNYSVSMKPVAKAEIAELTSTQNLTLRTASVSNPNFVSQTQYTSIEQATNEPRSSSIVYENALPHTDLEYIVDGDYVKENIIVKAPLTNYDFSFELTLDNMYAQIESDGSIGIYCDSSSERKYVIPSPYMYDANDTLSLDVTYELLQEDGKYYLTVDADESWIDSADRVFPVTIDPSFVVSTGNPQDTYSASDSPNTNFASSTSLWVQAGSITYIKVPSFSIPVGATLNWAYLTTFYYYSSAVTSGSVDVGAYKVVNDWNQNSLTWNSMNALPNRGLSTTQQDCQVAYGNAGATVSSPKQLDFSIVSAAREWINGEPNYGIGLKYEAGPNLSVVFRSYESGYSYRPRITYQYYIADSNASYVGNYEMFVPTSQSFSPTSGILKAVYNGDTAVTTLDFAYEDSERIWYISNQMGDGGMYAGLDIKCLKDNDAFSFFNATDCWTDLPDPVLDLEMTGETTTNTEVDVAIHGILEKDYLYTFCATWDDLRPVGNTKGKWHVNSEHSFNNLWSGDHDTLYYEYCTHLEFGPASGSPSPNEDDKDIEDLNAVNALGTSDEPPLSLAEEPALDSNVQIAKITTLTQLSDYIEKVAANNAVLANTSSEDVAATVTFSSYMSLADIKTFVDKYDIEALQLEMRGLNDRGGRVTIASQVDGDIDAIGDRLSPHINSAGIELVGITSMRALIPSERLEMISNDPCAYLVDASYDPYVVNSANTESEPASLVNSTRTDATTKNFPKSITWQLEDAGMLAAR